MYKTFYRISVTEDDSCEVVFQAFRKDLNSAHKVLKEWKEKMAQKGYIRFGKNFHDYLGDWSMSLLYSHIYDSDKPNYTICVDNSVTLTDWNNGKKFIIYGLEEQQEFTSKNDAVEYLKELEWKSKQI